MVQPVLVPCKRSADLFLSLDPADPGMAHIYWGTALLQRVPCDGSHPLLRLTAGLLYNLRFPARKLAECLPICDKTIRSIGLALRDSNPRDLLRTVLGQSDDEVLSADQKQYVRVRYRELRSECRDYRKRILGEVQRIWDVDPCGEVLRKCFREVDAEERSDESDRKATALMTAPLEELDGASAGADVSALPPVDSEADPRKGKSGCASGVSPSTTTRNASSLFEPAEDATVTGQGRVCAASEKADCRLSEPSSESHGGDTAPKPPPQSTPDPWPLPLPRLPQRPQWCAHAGLFTLLPWLEEGLGDAPAEIQQLAMQILAGAANHEGSRYTSFDSLELLGDPVHRSIRAQRTWCKAHAHDGVLETVLLGNARLARLYCELIFYFDPHTERYTGQLKTLLAWHGGLHGIAKGLHLDFIHTSCGFPCHVRHFDNYDDMRRRFLVSRAQFRELHGISRSVTWVADRGIWSRPFLVDLDALGDKLITWEKGYTAGKGRWSLHYTGSGKFSRWRCRNSRSDRYRYRFEWREQSWDAVQDGRRFVVRAQKPGGATVEVSIVTNNTGMSPERIIWLMFNRWIQENDFAYLRRHFGIAELTERGSESYAEIADELEDRQTESRLHKQARQQRRELERELAATLMEQRGHGQAGDIDALRTEAEKLHAKLPALSAELARLRQVECDSHSISLLGRLGERISDLGTQMADNREEQKSAETADQIERRAHELERSIAAIKARLEQIPKTESRIEALVEQHYVRLRMRAKPLVDAVRITCRNVFRRPLSIFRPIFDNRRTDHAVLRSLTRAPGMVSATPERIDVHLLPAMTVEPAERERIRKFLDICEHRAAATAALSGGPIMRFHLLLNSTEISTFMRRL